VISVERIAVAALACLLASCVGGPSRSALPQGEAVSVVPVKNLSGVTLRVPELWLGDAGDQAASLNVELIDLRLLAEAGLRAGLQASGHGVHDSARHELHAAITRFDMSQLRSTGRVSIGLAVMLVDSRDSVVLAESEIVRDCQLLDRPPQQTGVVGEQRFIRRRLEMFCESLAREVLLDAGM
jgi:hypothetical protein